jgi:hypothetical protein
MRADAAEIARLRAASGLDTETEQLVMSLASYVSGDDIGKDRTEFLRSVAGRILEDLGI